MLRIGNFRRLVGGVGQCVDPDRPRCTTPDRCLPDMSAIDWGLAADQPTATASACPASTRAIVSWISSRAPGVAITCGIPLPLTIAVDRLRRLNSLRNGAAHRGMALGHQEARDAVQVMIDFLGAHGLRRRSDGQDPDGGEWVLKGS